MDAKLKSICGTLDVLTRSYDTGYSVWILSGGLFHDKNFLLQVFLFRTTFIFGAWSLVLFSFSLASHALLVPWSPSFISFSPLTYVYDMCKCGGCYNIQYVDLSTLVRAHSSLDPCHMLPKDCTRQFEPDTVQAVVPVHKCSAKWFWWTEREVCNGDGNVNGAKSALVSWLTKFLKGGSRKHYSWLRPLLYFGANKRRSCLPHMSSM
jgi:hypothetical protein